MLFVCHTIPSTGVPEVHIVMAIQLFFSIYLISMKSVVAVSMQCFWLDPESMLYAACFILIFQLLINVHINGELRKPPLQAGCG